MKSIIIAICLLFAVTAGAIEEDINKVYFYVDRIVWVYNDQEYKDFKSLIKKVEEDIDKTKTITCPVCGYDFEWKEKQ